MADLTKYAQLKGQGASATDVWLAAEADGLDQITRIFVMREVFQLSIVEAKAVSVQAQTGCSLKEHQAKLLEGLDEALKSED